jgi:hypothetical protein
MFLQFDWDFSLCSVGNLEHSVLVDTCVHLRSILLHAAQLIELLTIRKCIASRVTNYVPTAERSAPAQASISSLWSLRYE